MATFRARDDTRDLCAALQDARVLYIAPAASDAPAMIVLTDHHSPQTRWGPQALLRVCFGGPRRVTGWPGRGIPGPCSGGEATRQGDELRFRVGVYGAEEMDLTCRSIEVDLVARAELDRLGVSLPE